MSHNHLNRQHIHYSLMQPIDEDPTAFLISVCANKQINMFMFPISYSHRHTVFSGFISIRFERKSLEIIFKCFPTPVSLCLSLSIQSLSLFCYLSISLSLSLCLSLWLFRTSQTIKSAIALLGNQHLQEAVWSGSFSVHFQMQNMVMIVNERHTTYSVRINCSSGMLKSRLYTIGVLYYCSSLLWSRYPFLCSRIIFNIWNLKVTVLCLMQNVINTEQICVTVDKCFQKMFILHIISTGQLVKKQCAIHKISYIFNYILNFVSKICYQPEATCTHGDVQPLKILLIIIWVSNVFITSSSVLNSGKVPRYIS